MKTKRGWGGSGWGSWHTGDGSACPQGCDRRHSVEQAVELNQTANEERREALRAAHERWLGRGTSAT